MELYIISIDFKQAFDQLKRNQIRRDLKNMAITKKLRDVLKISTVSIAVINMGKMTTYKIQIRCITYATLYGALDAVIQKRKDQKHLITT